MTENFVVLCNSISALISSRVRGSDNIRVTNLKIAWALKEIDIQRRFTRKCKTEQTARAQERILGEMVSLFCNSTNLIIK